jgi:4-hydroxy-tetrahydrodipicolinate reductase
MTTVGVIGSKGRMGALACAAVRGAEGLELGAEVDLGDAMESLQGCEVAVDFTHPGVVMDHVAWCIDHGVHLVVGTSGFTDERLDTVRTRLGDQPSVGVLVVPNFSIGAVLMMRFAAEAAAFFDSVEIVEMHHPDKLDAPSGTALRTAHLVAQARRQAGLGEPPDATETDDLGSRGGQVDGVRLHSIRLRGAVAHQEVVLGNLGETLTVRHDMLDRAAAMSGMLACVRAVPRMPGLTVGLETVLGLPDR